MSENNSDDDIKKNYNGKRKRKSDESFAEKKIKIEHDVFNCNGMKGDEEALSIASSSKWLNPVEMSHVVDIIKGYIKGKDQLRSKKFNNFTNYSIFDLPEMDKMNLRIDLKRYLKEAVQISSISFGAAIDLLHNFLADGSSITLHPDFPKKPPSSFVLFCKKRGDVKHGIWHFKDLSAMWKNDDYKEEKLACEKESLDLQRNYMENLEKFKANNKNLTDSHNLFIDKTIQSCQRMINKKEPRKHTKNSVKPKSQSGFMKTQKTAFELFFMANSKKYCDLEPEKRNKKLLKKFNKLSDDQRAIYQSLASAL